MIPKLNLNDDENDNILNPPKFPSVYSVDGEAFPIEPMQGRVLNKAIKIFCLNPNSN